MKVSMMPLPDSCYDNRPSGWGIDTIIIHSMPASLSFPWMTDAEICWQTLMSERLSAHYAITPCGDIYCFVDEGYRAWHAGRSIMPEPDNRMRVNDFSIGIEIIVAQTISLPQYNSLAQLCASLRGRYDIQENNILGHSDIAGDRAVAYGIREAHDIKTDPGDEFDWPLFKRLLRTQQPELHLS